MRRGTIRSIVRCDAFLSLMAAFASSAAVNSVSVGSRKTFSFSSSVLASSSGMYPFFAAARAMMAMPAATALPCVTLYAEHRSMACPAV